MQAAGAAVVVDELGGRAAGGVGSVVGEPHVGGVASASTHEVHAAAEKSNAGGAAGAGGGAAAAPPSAAPGSHARHAWPG